MSNTLPHNTYLVNYLSVLQPDGFSITPNQDRRESMYNIYD